MRRKTITSARRPNRKTRAQRADWVVRDDEFHPDARVAALDADRLARLAALRNARLELDRAERKLLTSRASGSVAGERAALDAMQLWQTEVAYVLNAIDEASEAVDDA